MKIKMAVIAKRADNMTNHLTVACYDIIHLDYLVHVPKTRKINELDSIDIRQGPVAVFCKENNGPLS